MERTPCRFCGNTGPTKGWPCCARQARAIEDAYWLKTRGTTDLAARGYRSYWD